MKKFILTFFVLVLSLFTSCKQSDDKAQATVIPVELATTTFNIEGMHCEVGCAARVEKKLAKLDGVQEASVDFENKLATVTYNKNVQSAEDLVETVINVSKDYVVSNVNTSTVNN